MVSCLLLRQTLQAYLICKFNNLFKNRLSGKSYFSIFTHVIVYLSKSTIQHRGETKGSSPYFFVFQK